MSRIFRHPIVRVRAPLSTNRHNQTVRDWPNATRVTIPGWAVDAGESGETLGSGREAGSSTYTIRKLGPRADIEATDRIELFGTTYSVDGPVRWQPGATARTSHTIVVLRLSEG